MVTLAIASSVIFFAPINRTHLRQSAFGHLIRRFRGETGAQQIVNDLAENYGDKAILGPLQAWSLETMARFDSGKIATNGFGPNWPVNAIVISSNEIPAFVKQLIPNNEPEVAVAISTNSHAECVIIDWYLYGLVIGPARQDRSFFPLYDDIANRPIIPLYDACISPGAFAIWYDAK